MKCKSVQEQIHSLVGGELSAWEAWQVKRHCALCPACQSRRKQAEQWVAGLRGLAALPTPERVRAAVFAQLPAIQTETETYQNTVYHMQISLGLDARTRRRHALRRLVGVGGVTAAIGMSGLLIAPHILPGFPDVRAFFNADLQDAQHVAEVNQSLNSPEREAQFLAKAKSMRERWKPWALGQKPHLRQMLAGDKEGFAALMRIYQDLPTGLPEGGDGLTYRDLNGGGLSFTWQPAAKLGMTARYNPTSPFYQGKERYSKEQQGATPPDPVAVSYDAPLQKQPGKRPLSSRATAEERMLKQVKAQYVSFHDIELSRSISTGANYCTLWVSGRVTKTTLKTHLVGGRWELESPKIHEICPPYEELTR